MKLRCASATYTRSIQLQLMASVASISIATFTQILTPSSVLAACTTTNGRFVVNGGSSCPSTNGTFAPTNQNQAPIDVSDGQGTITNPNVSITGGTNSIRALYVRETNRRSGHLQINGDTTVTFNTTNAEPTAAIDVRSSSTLEVNGDLTINTNTQGIATIGGSELRVNGDIEISSTGRGVNVRDADSVNQFISNAIAINTTGDSANGLRAGTRGQILIGAEQQTSPSSGATVIISKGTDLRVTTQGERSSGISAVYDNLGNFPANDAIILIDRAVVRTRGGDSEGIYAQVTAGGGSALVEAANIDVATSGENSDGLIAKVSDGDIVSAINGSSTVRMSSGTISTTGDGSAGIIAQTDFSLFTQSTGSAIVDMSGGSITTTGTGAGQWGLDGSHGIFAGAAGSGNAIVSHTGGAITTSGAVAHGIYGVSNLADVRIFSMSDQRVNASGNGADAIRATIVQSGNAQIVAGGALNGGLGSAAGIATNADTSSITILEGAFVTAQSGTAIHAKGTLSNEQAGRATILSLGHLEGDIITVAGNDVIELTGTSITNGDINTLGGEDSLLLAGQYAGTVHLGQGNDILEFAAGSVSAGAISMDDAAAFGSDRAIIRAGANVSGLTLLDGGDDVYTADNFVDSLIFDGGSQTINADIVQNWEQVAIVNGASIKLGGSVLKTGSGQFQIEQLGLTIGAQSALSFENAAFNLIGDITNAGVISLQNGVAGDRLTLSSDPLSPSLSGIYNGQSGYIRLDTVLGDSNSPSDRLVLDGGRAEGTTGLVINRVGGTGAKTDGDGIMVVEAANGATTAADSFQLAQPVGVGAYDYNLFHGGVAADTRDNWYLRSARNPRIEVFSNQLVPVLAHDAGLAQLGTFHERTGGKFVIGAYSEDQHPVWSRTFGNTVDLQQRSSRDSAEIGASDYDGKTLGTQIGIDLFGHETEDGAAGRFGVFGTYSHSSGETAKDINATASFDNVKFNSTAIGAYYTYITPQDAYFDLVGMIGWIDGQSRSSRGLGNEIDGTYQILSAEFGQKFALSEGWFITPQAQLIWQSVQLDDSFDMISSIRYGDVSPLTGRLGIRLDKQSANKDVQFYTSADLWHRMGARDGYLFFDEDRIDYKMDRTSVKVAAGLSYAISETITSFAQVNYEHSISGDKSRAFGGQAGLRVKF